jgi:Acyl-CoA dehydrogenase, C-terminal domain/Berberine and berberine like
MAVTILRHHDTGDRVSRFACEVARRRQSSERNRPAKAGLLRHCGAGTGFTVTGWRVAFAREKAREMRANGTQLIDDPAFRQRVAQIEVEMKALDITQHRVVSAYEKRDAGRPDPLSSALKIKGTELLQTTTELAMDVGGPLAMPDWSQKLQALSNEPELGPAWAAEATKSYLFLRAASIYGGTNEIQKNILTKAAASDTATCRAHRLGLGTDWQLWPACLSRHPRLRTRSRGGARRGGDDRQRHGRAAEGVVPEPAFYVSESNFFEKDWQRAYWGANHRRLKTVKAMYDPDSLFFVHHGVGSEEWSDDGFERREGQQQTGPQRGTFADPTAETPCLSPRSACPRRGLWFGLPFRRRAEPRAFGALRRRRGVHRGWLAGECGFDPPYG